MQRIILPSNPGYTLSLRSENGYVTLIATDRVSGDSIEILGLGDDGIRILGPPMEGLPCSVMVDNHGNEWHGITVAFDGTSLDTDCLVPFKPESDPPTGRGLPLYTESVGTFVTPSFDFLTADQHGGIEPDNETPVEDVVDEFLESISDSDMVLLYQYATRHGQVDRLNRRAVRSVGR